MSNVAFLSVRVSRCLSLLSPLQDKKNKMNVGVAHSEVNPNTRVMNSRGIWLTYALGVGMLHIVLLSIPFFSVPVVWTLTNVIHNFVSVLRKEVYTFYTSICLGNHFCPFLCVL